MLDGSEYAKTKGLGVRCNPPELCPGPVGGVCTTDPLSGHPVCCKRRHTGPLCGTCEGAGFIKAVDQHCVLCERTDWLFVAAAVRAPLCLVEAGAATGYPSCLV